MEASGSSESPSLDMRRYGVVLRRRWLAISTGVLLGCLAAAAVYVLYPPMATSATLVNANVISSTPFEAGRPASDLLDSETETQLARSTEVVTSVSEAMGGDLSPSGVRRATSATLLPNGTVLRITFKTENRNDAIQGANLIAQAYLDYRSELAQEKVDTASEQLANRREALAKELAGLQGRLAKTSDPTTKLGLQAQISAANGTLQAVSTELTTLQALDTTGGTVLTSADGGTTVTSPSPKTLVLGGVLGGLLLGVLIAFAANTLDRRVWDDEDVEDAGGGKVLGHLSDRVARIPAERADADVVRSLRERLLATSPDRRVVAIADVGSHWMPSDVAVNLAIVSAQIGVKVHLVLVEQSEEFLRKVHSVLDLSAGTTGALRTSTSGAYPGLTVTSARIESLEESSSADRVAELLRGGQVGDHFTLIAVPYDASGALRLATGRLVDAFILSVGHRDATIDQVATLSAELRSVNATIYGSVLVPAKRRFAGGTRSRAEGGRRAEPRATETARG